MVIVFSFCWWYVSYAPEKPPVVALRRFFDNAGVDPSERRHFQILHVATRPLAMNEFGFVEAVNRLSEGIIIGIPDAANRVFDASFGQTFSMANGQILAATVAVMYQSAFRTGRRS